MVKVPLCLLIINGNNFYIRFCGGVSSCVLYGTLKVTHGFHGGNRIRASF